MKKLLAMLLALVMVLSFAACSEEPVDDSSSGESVDDSSSEESSSEEESTAATYTLGMGINVSTASSKDGQAQADATVAVVVLDAEGKIVSVQFDCAQTKVKFESGVLEDLTAVDVRSKWTKKEDYGMASASPIGAEWYTQVDALEEALVGMTAADIEAIELVEKNEHMVAVDETLYAACTMDLTGFKEALLKACNDEYAREFTADEFTLGLGVVTDVSSTTAPTDDKNGTAALYTEFAGVVTDAEGKILSVLCDVIQVKVGFDKTGAITEDYTFGGSKKELKEDYGMSAIGAVEWYIQTTAFEDQLIGMTLADVEAIELVEKDEHMVAVDETLYAACTMDLTGFKASIADSANNTK